MEPHHERAVSDLLMHFFEVKNELDPAVLLDRRLVAAVDEGRATELEEALSAALTLPLDDPNFRDWFDQGGIPDGPPGPFDDRMKPYLTMAAARLRAIHTGHVVIPAAPDGYFDGQTWPRAGTFADSKIAAAATELVQSQHAEELELLRRGDLPWERMHLHSDVSSALGIVGEVDIVAAPSSAGERPRVVDTVLTTHVSVVVGRDRPRGLQVVVANPDVALDTSTRTAFPALCHYFGSFFGPGRVRLYSDPYHQSMAANLSTKPGGRRLVAEQLDALLSSTADDRELIRVLEACGSYVLPQAVRHWLDRLRWRLDAYDWGEARGRWFS